MIAVLATFGSLIAVSGTSNAAPKSAYLLQPTLSASQRATVEANLEVGGHLLVPKNREENEKRSNSPASVDDKKQSNLTRLPLSVVAKLHYQQHLTQWSKNGVRSNRAIRYYDQADATIKVADGRVQRTLTNDSRLVLAEIRDNRQRLDGLQARLTREEFDLINLAGNPLVLDRLLPGKRLAEGEQWRHDQDVIGALLGLDHTAICEVTSVITGETKSQVQIQIAGTVHGTIDGTATEMNLKGAYLFHLRKGRITKFNLAIKETRSPGPVAPGLDVVAKLKLTIIPCKTLGNIGKKALVLAQEQTRLDHPELIYRSPSQGFEFRHAADWYVTADGRDLVALGQLAEGELVAHCNIKVLPSRAKGRQTPLDQFERDIRQSLGEHFKGVAAANQWTTPAGHESLGIIVHGAIEGVPLQWRYYLISSADMPRVSLVFTLEQPKEDAFADADRSIVDSLRLFQPSTVREASNKATSTR